MSAQRTVTIDDTLQSDVDGAIEEVQGYLTEYLSENPSEDELPCISNDLDYSGRIHEIIDGAVPIYTSNITDLWYLYASEFEEAYTNAGVGDNPRENNGMAAIYYYIHEKVYEWYSSEAESYMEGERDELAATYCGKGVEVFHVSESEFAEAKEDTWMHDRAFVNEGSSAESLAGWYYWHCKPGCLPDTEADGPHKTEETAMMDAWENS